MASQSVTNGVLKFWQGFNQYFYQFIVHESTSEQPSRDLLIAAGAWSQTLHDEVWVFNQGFWEKDSGLWQEVQKANWADVILDEDSRLRFKRMCSASFLPNVSIWSSRSLGRYCRP